MTNTTLSPSDALLGPDADWWRQAAVYQIYPRSFADANGDGVGDLRGILSRVDYLKGLGIDAVWMSPFYPSALADGGYDVDDYRDVDPRIGTLAEFDELVAALHARSLKLIVDIVPNHSSDRHVWFQEALAAGPGSPERDRYIFRDGLGENGELPPADWTSTFGGPAWTRVADGQWYFHMFAKEQPDWNWANREIRDDFLKTLAFWADRGVDGFRIDVAHALTKRLPEPLPTAAELADPTLFPVGDHPLSDRDDVQEVYAEWRELFNRYSPPLTAVAEAWVPADRRVRYASRDSLGQAFNFDLLRATWNPEEFRTIIRDNLALAGQSGASSTWVFSNHDVVRHASRYGLPSGGEGREWLLSGGTSEVEDRDLGVARARAVSLLAFALPGSAYLYQGEELGLPEVVDIPESERQDPAFFRNRGVEIGRDGCRVPLPWTTEGSSFGFGSGDSHLPQPVWWGDYSVETEEADDSSTLHFYRRALALRHELQTAEELSWIDAPESVVAFRRPGGWVSVTNFGVESVELPAGRVVIASGALDGDRLPADTTAWIVVDAD
ncbi:Oligo-1,6-glucosidase [Frondihabitans sp. 762G35]|uniref:glycoside hydrolase family 13 protein n=1 Tax=Frondihabitans sp. 762G35 TaxID=1446794 RepID=UPI000D20BEF7|nr:alpha-amylase family glycosyl hydrolase [Frondihabitans sp. 762G35]ARC58384.1 Oligo-1,6-glucosidase [Frondihabitans sp. 762G35]